MDIPHKLSVFLDEVLQREDSLPIDTLSSYIVGELLGDLDGRYGDLYERNPKVRRLADLASDLERSNVSNKEVQAMWVELKALAEEIRSIDAR